VGHPNKGVVRWIESTKE